jgi:hypothetical protein
VTATTKIDVVPEKDTILCIKIDVSTLEPAIELLKKKKEKRKREQCRFFYDKYPKN